MHLNNFFFPVLGEKEGVAFSLDAAFNLVLREPFCVRNISNTSLFDQNEIRIRIIRISEFKFLCVLQVHTSTKCSYKIFRLYVFRNLVISFMTTNDRIVCSVRLNF